MKMNFKRIVQWVMFSVLGLIGAGIIIEQSFQIHFNFKKPGESEFCEINGLKVHYKKKGNGGPTVVFQSGLGGDYKIWEEIQDSLSKHTTTISYDRAGLLWSEPANETKTLENITAELEQLVEKTNCPKPYILVGHSLAGITLRPFIKNNPEDISAVVFADVSHPLQIKNSSEELKKYLVVPPKWLITTLMETGIARFYFTLQPFMADLPKSHWMNRHVRNYFYTSYEAFLQEANDDDPMFEQAETINHFGDIPLTIISGAYPKGADFLGKDYLAKEYLTLHRSQQKDLLQLSTKSKQIIAQNSGHYVPLQDAEIVIASVKEYLPAQVLEIKSGI